MTNSRPFLRPLGEYGGPLGPDDYARLERSWISREIADSALIRRVTNEEGREIVGRRDFADYAGLLFPYLWPGRPGVFAHRIRRDNAPYEIRNGQRKEREKYLSAPGWGNTLYFHPLTPAGSLSDVAVPLVFTEGQKKCLALFRLANEGATETNEHMLFVPVGLNGSMAGVTDAKRRSALLASECR